MSTAAPPSYGITSSTPTHEDEAKNQGPILDNADHRARSATIDSLKVEDAKGRRPRASSNASTASFISTTSMRSGTSGGHSAYEVPSNATSQASITPSALGLQQDDAQGCMVLSPQMLHIYVLDLSSKDHLITLEDKKTVIYTSEAHQWSSTFGSSNSDVELRRGGQNGPMVATADIHRLSKPSQIKLITQNKTLPLDRDSLTSIRYTCQHPLHGNEYMWSSTHKDTSFFSHGNLKLEDSQGNMIARFTSSDYKSISKRGKLEILQATREDELDWVIITCLTMIEKERRRRKKKAGGAGAVGGASASASASAAA